MARKTTGTTNPTRSKKAVSTVPPVTEQIAAPVQKDVQKEEPKVVLQEARPEVRQDAAKDLPKKEIRKNAKTANVVAAKVPAAVPPAAIEEQIRRRAYELYLERRATAGMSNGYGYGDENQDWLIAEREIRSRQENQGHHSA